MFWKNEDLKNNKSTSDKDLQEYIDNRVIEAIDRAFLESHWWPSDVASELDSDVQTPLGHFIDRAERGLMLVIDKRIDTKISLKLKDPDTIRAIVAEINKYQLNK